jgi:hypothetical protein
MLDRPRPKPRWRCAPPPLQAVAPPRSSVAQSLLTATLALAALILPLSASAQAQEPSPRATAAALLRRHAELQPTLDASPLGVPVLVTSLESGDRTRGEVHAVLAQPFELLAARLGAAREWCAMMTLHLNVKGCTHERAQAQDWLTLYSGRKVYEPVDKAHPIRFGFRAVSASNDFLDIDLTAPDGPLGTSDYRIDVSAVALPRGSFVRLAYSYRSSAMSRLAVSGYLATLGRDKIGFTIVGKRADGQPEFVQGRRGIVERNAVRYYLAIQAGLEGQALPAAQRLAHDLARWFELTERFPAQLHELERDEYLQFKRREFDEQARRQRALDAKSGRGESESTSTSTSMSTSTPASPTSPAATAVPGPAPAIN